MLNNGDPIALKACHKMIQLSLADLFRSPNIYNHFKVKFAIEGIIG